MANVGDKYIIEIAEIYASSYRNVALTEEQIKAPTYLYRIKGFNSLVFDENGLNKLEKYEEFTQEDCDRARREGYQEGYSKAENDYHQQTEVDRESARQFGYEQGLNDAWEAATRIVLEGGKNDLSPEELEEIFKTRSLPGIFASYSASEAISKIKAYEEQKKAEEEIKVGDEVLLYCGNRIVVTKIYDNTDKTLEGMIYDGSFARFLRSDIRKVIGYVDIDGILKAMRED